MVAAAHADVLAILTRAPSAGGKTRLFRELGVEADAALLRALLLDTVDAAADPRFERVIAVTPESGCDEVAQLVPGVRVIPQPSGDLGDRMRATMRRLFEEGARRVALVGSDVPGIDPALILDGFAVLRREPEALVLGPSFDGGYYLIAACGVPPVFDGVEWGSAGVLRQTCALASRAGIDVHLLDARGDVDDRAGLERTLATGRAARTAEWARRFLMEGRQDS